MRGWILFLLSISCFAEELRKENVPSVRREASHVLPFFIPKDFTDGSLTRRFLQQLKDCFHVETFVETGTHLGNTTHKASELFSAVHTVEVFPEFYSLAAKRFECVSHVHVHLGDSGVVLGSILSSCDQKVLFYLDGHYDGGERSGKGKKYTPLLEELAAIKAWGWSDSVIVIDDLCDFQASRYPERIEGTCFAGYPDLGEVVSQLLAINPAYQVCCIPNALLAFAPTPDVSVSSLLRACTIDRLSTISGLFSEQELVEAEKVIGSAQGAERRELEAYFEAYSSFERHFGWRSFASFWKGLLLLQEGKRLRAAEVLSEAASSSLPGWRVNVY